MVVWINRWKYLDLTSLSKIASMIGAGKAKII
jgi:hypothetical protein